MRFLSVSRRRIGGLLIALSCVLAGCSKSETPYKDVIVANHLEAVSDSVLNDANVARQLATLHREPCDVQAGWRLSNALANNGFRREAANVLIRFPKRCAGKNVIGFLRGAMPLLRAVGDLGAARVIADQVVAADKTLADSRFDRAEVLSDMGDFGGALADYEAAIALSRDPAHLISSVYVGAAKASAALGEPCHAAALIRQWVAYEPQHRNVPQAQAMIKEYADAGRCAK